MFRDFISFAVGAIVALASVMPYDVCAKKFEKERAWFARIYRLGEIESRAGLDVEWIEETHTWTDLQKECAKTAAEVVCKTEAVRAEWKKTPVGYGKIAEKFEKNLDPNPYDFINGLERGNGDKQVLSSVMEARNVKNTNLIPKESDANIKKHLLKHFDEDVPPVTVSIGTRRIPNTHYNHTPIRTTAEPPEFERRADLVATPDVVEPALERLLDEVEIELEANANESNKNENEQPVIPTETLAGDA